jgi:hypothetical protein
MCVLDFRKESLARPAVSQGRRVPGSCVDLGCYYLVGLFAFLKQRLELLCFDFVDRDIDWLGAKLVWWKAF